MSSVMRAFLLSTCLVGLSLPTPEASAASGDTLRVTAERVNLRAGPSDGANVRGQITGGEQLLELRQDGNWYGVRVLRTGEEGWIFGDLVERVSSSLLAGGSAETTAGFKELSPDFDRAMASLGQRFGYPIVTGVRQLGGNDLEVKLTPAWLRSGSSAEHLLAATAIYQMWKNHQNSAPVRVMVRDAGGGEYITIDETSASGPLFTVSGQ